MFDYAPLDGLPETVVSSWSYRFCGCIWRLSFA